MKTAPVVRRRRIIEKLRKGFTQQEWQLIGYTGSFEKAIIPLVRYLQRRGVKVD